MKEITHISKEQYIAFQQNRLTSSEQIKLMEHICSCNYCSDQFASLVSNEMLSAPRDFKHNLLEATKRFDIQVTMKARETSKRLQLFFYSLKVGGAILGALLLLLLTVKVNDPVMLPKYPEDKTAYDETASITTLLKDRIDDLNSYLQDFSYSIIKTEGLDNDQKEK